MAYLVDTNILVRWTLPVDPLYTLVHDAIVAARADGETVYITTQNLIEFHAVATRAADANGLGMTSAEARTRAQAMEHIFPLLPDVPAVYAHWLSLVDGYGVVGRQVFDARLAAVMLAHGVTHLLTLNPAHFRRYAGITVVEPQEVTTTAGGE